MKKLIELLQALRRRVSLPYLHVHIDTGWVCLKAEVFCKNYYQDRYEYIRLGGSVFGKVIDVGLYRPGRIR